MVYCCDDEVREQIRKEMQLQDMKCADLARESGLGLQKVSRMLNKEKLKFSEISQLCDALDCDLYIEVRSRNRLSSNDNAVDTLRRAINILKRMERHNID